MIKTGGNTTGNNSETPRFFFPLLIHIFFDDSEYKLGNDRMRKTI